MSVQQAFDKGARDYDSARKQLIPCFDDFYGTALALINRPQSDSFQVLDLGAGTGLFTSLVAQHYPNASFTLCDISSAMLSEAKNRFKHSAFTIDYQTKDYSAEPLVGKYDLIISALSIHHLDAQAKAALFQNIYHALNEGGQFINADQVLGETAQLETSYRNAWLKQVKEKGVTANALSAALERMKEDKMSTLSQQLQWMKDAQFQQVNCWYKNYSFVVFSGDKSLVIADKK
ncbi:Carboxy-S-adenosyl-L-methionine synthase [Vibrio stylophorae]|uniref:Carboxy-S-adenosyl-L-methionine synthase n=1 Tax=Vibrio stylophorae TaxID=659351 RepID=A0ABM8ZWU5_9VIBR|nr:class I SAM-dependent methyltransferase [Vibrio stylophorae]CAH0535119.1 Carboxy-S-adenosyl-L-methionine synthase [Vibrio stylophorae]